MTAEPRPLEYGSITDVTEALPGDELAADVAAGALTLQLSDAVDFDEDGGSVSIDDGAEVVAYSAADLDADTLSLSVALAGSYLAGTPVRPEPNGLERRALVMLDLDGEAIDARVPHALFDRLDLGTRSGVYERVSLYLDGSEWVVEDVLGQEPVVDGAYITNLPPPPPPVLTDGLPPNFSPAPTVIGGVGVLHVRWVGIENHDPVTYELHVSTLDGFTPSASTLVTETPATSATVRTLPDGTPLAYDVTYFARLVAKDADPGTAPASTQSPGASLYKVGNTEISAGYAYLGELSADKITAGDIDVAVTVSGEVKTSAQGQRVVMDGQGLHLFTSAGTPLVDLPTDPSKPVSIKNVDAEVQNLAVKGGLSIEVKGTVGAGAGLELVGGVVAPANPPGVTLDHEVGGAVYTLPIPAGVQGSALSMYVEAVAFDANYAYLSARTQGAGYLVARCPRDGGAATHTKLYTQGGWGLAVDPATGLLWIGERSDFNRTIHPYNPDLTDAGGAKSCPATSGTGKVTKGLAIYNGTAYACHVAGSSYFPVVEAITLSSGASTSYTANAGPSGVSNTYGFGFSAGVWDFTDGLLRYAVNLAGKNYVYELSGGFLVERPADEWENGAEGGVVANDPFAWSPGEGVFRQVESEDSYGATETTTSFAYKKFTNTRWTTESALWWASYTWRDSDPAGAAGTSETDQGKRASFTMKPRYRLRLSSAAIPDYGGTDDPNAVSFYVGRGASDPTRTGMFLQGGTLADGQTSLTLTAVGFSGTNPPASNDFPGSTPGYISSGAKRQDGTPKTKLDGLGGANVDGLIPPGSVQMYAGATAPAGWALCDGTALNTATSPDLFAVIGYSFGGSGTSFNVPDLRDRFPIGASSTSYPRGQQTSTSRFRSLPAHTHDNTLGTGMTGAGHTHDLSLTTANLTVSKQTNTSTGGTATRVNDLTGETVAAHSHAGSTALSTGGSGHTHNVTGSVGGVTAGSAGSIDIQPAYASLNFIIKL